MPQPKFEAALSRLEETVKSLEEGDLSLEASLKVFEEGVRLSKTCMKTLDEAEKKVEFLMTGKKSGKSSASSHSGAAALKASAESPDGR